MRRVALFLSPLLAIGLIWTVAGGLLPAVAGQGSASPAAAPTAVPDRPSIDEGEHGLPVFVSPDGEPSLPGGAAPLEEPAPPWTSGQPLAYSVKWICETITEAQYPDALGDYPHLLPGTYRTAINVHNPALNDYLYLGLSWHVADPNQVEGDAWYLTSELELGPDQSLEMDCDDIKYLEYVAGGESYPKGLALITSTLGQPADVTAVYTAQHVSPDTGDPAVGLGQAIDVEPAPGFSPPAAGLAEAQVYSAKFVCGKSAGPDPVVVGDYATAINVRNPNGGWEVETSPPVYYGFTVGFKKKVVLAEREDETFGAITAYTDPADINMGRAWEMDCSEIMSMLAAEGKAPKEDTSAADDSCIDGVDNTGSDGFDLGDTDCFIKGFVVIETVDNTGAPPLEGVHGELDVVPVYTVRRPADAVSGYGFDLDVLRVTKKTKAAAPTEPTGTPTPTATPTATATPTPTPTEAPTEYVYTCYDTFGMTVFETVSLITQFGSESATVAFGQELCAPADKDVFVNPDQETHFRWYMLSSSNYPGWRVTLYTQFGEPFDVTVGQAMGLWVTTGKSFTGIPELLPEKAYECFDISGQHWVNWWVPVSDQFVTDRSVLVGEALFLCAPAQKDTYPNPDPDTHFVCFDILTDPAYVPGDYVYLNTQFDPEYVTVGAQHYLCTQALKSVVLD